MSTWTQVSPGSSVPQPVNDPASITVLGGGWESHVGWGGTTGGRPGTAAGSSHLQTVPHRRLPGLQRLCSAFQQKILIGHIPIFAARCVLLNSLCWQSFTFCCSRPYRRWIPNGLDPKCLSIKWPLLLLNMIWNPSNFGPVSPRSICQ